MLRVRGFISGRTTIEYRATDLPDLYVDSIRLLPNNKLFYEETLSHSCMEALKARNIDYSTRNRTNIGKYCSWDFAWDFAVYCRHWYCRKCCSYLTGHFNEIAATNLSSESGRA